MGGRPVPVGSHCRWNVWLWICSPQLTKDLGLTPDQAKQLDAILIEWHGRLKAIHEQADVQIAELRQKGRDEIRATLTPEQKPKFEEFLRKLDEARKRNNVK